MDDLQSRWKFLYAEHLPAMAKARDPNQKHWPVYLDHCFARIVLDNAIGVDRPWMEATSSPAIKHMSQAQFKKAIELAEAIASGAADLDDLDQRSLELRGKSKPSSKRKDNHQDTQAGTKKPKQSGSTANISSYFLPSPQSPAKDTTAPAQEAISSDATEQENSHVDAEMDVQLRRIADSNLTHFRKQTLGLLCQVPRGRYSTYQAMSDYITRSSHKTCARAVGNAMRNNPFAPQVPCHRILAADGTLGGFNGHWGENGKFASDKHMLLKEEGVRFDSRGKVKGPPFRGFHTLL